MLNKLITGAMFNIANIFIQVVLGLLVFREMLLFFGESDFGYWSVIMAILAHVILFEFGLGSVISKLIASDNKSQNEVDNQLVSCAFLVIFSVAAIFILLGISGLIFYHFNAQNTTFSNGTPIIIVAFLLSINFALNFVSGAFQSYLVGLFYVGTVNSIRLIINISRSLAIIGLLNWGYGVLEVAYVFFVLAFIELSLRIYFSLKAGYLDVVKLNTVTKSEFSYLKKRGGRLIFLRFNDYVRNNSSILMVGFILGSAAVVPLRISGRLMEIYVEISSSVNYLLTPYFSKVSALGDEKFYSSFKVSIAVSTTLSLFIYFNITSHAEWFLTLWLGEYSPVTLDSLLIFAFGFCIANMQGPSTSMLITKDFYKYISYLCFLEMIITLVAMFFFIKQFGVLGAAYAPVLALTLVRGGLQPYLVAKSLSVPFNRYILNIIVPAIIVSAFFFIVDFCARYLSEAFLINYVGTYLSIEAFVSLGALYCLYKRVKK